MSGNLRINSSGEVATHSPSLSDGRPQWVVRCRILGLCLLVAMGALAARSYWLQGVQGGYYSAISASNAVHQRMLRPSRGVLLAADGTVLAANRPAYDLVFVPRGVDPEKYDSIAENLAGIIETSKPDIFSRLKKGRFRPLTPILLRSNISKEMLGKVMEKRGRLPGVIIEERTLRSYPRRSEAAHLLGYIGEATEKEIDESSSMALGDLVGRSGLESVMEEFLAGRKGRETVLLDARGQTVRRLSRAEPVSGSRVTLTIDADLQKWAHEAFEGKHGAFVALEPSTGRILALYSSPLYDPNIFVDSNRSKERMAVFNDTNVPLYNRVLQAQYAPGSTFKLVTMIAGLSSGKLKENFTVDCNGFYAGMKCWKKEGHGKVSLRTAFQNSCNVFFYRAGEIIWSDDISRTANAMGMGVPPGFGVGPEATGVVPTPEWERKNVRGGDGEHWGTGDVRNMAIGQGYVIASPAQMALVVAAAASGGKRMKPQVIEKVEEYDGTVVRKFEPEELSDLGLTEEQVKFVREAMMSVVAAGTAVRGQVPGLSVGGKTGTAQAPQGADHGWFIGAAPMDDPRIAFCVFVEHAGMGGGKSAAPIAAQVLDKYARKKGWIL